MSWHTPPLIGREGELHAMAEALERAAAGCPTLVEVAAEAGFGKTRLIGACLDARPGVTVLAAGCYEDDVRPWSLVGRLREALVRATARPPAAPASAAPDRASDDGRSSDDDRATDDVEAEVGRDVAIADEIADELAGLVGDLLADVADGGLAVVVLEDLHWADAMSVDVLLPLAARIGEIGRVGAGCRLAVIVSYRPFELDDRTRRVLDRLSGQVPASCRVQPTPLDALQVNALVLGMGYPKPSGRLLAALVESSAGNPLHVRNVMDRLEVSNRLQREGGTCDAIGRRLPTDLGHDLVGALELRLKVLPDDERDLLGVVALLDPPATVEAVAAAAAESAEVTFDRLAAAQRERLIDLDDDVIGFRHPLLPVVLSRQLSPSRRAELEWRIARGLRGSGDERDLVGAGRHLSRAGAAAPPGTVLDVCGAAARAAFARGDYPVAADLAEAAIVAAATPAAAGDVPPHDVGRLHLLAGLARFRDHDPSAWQRHTEAAISIARTTGDLALWCDAELLATRARMTFGPHPVDDAPLRAVLAQLGPHDDVRRGRIHQELAELSFGAGHYDDGARLGAEALAAAEPSGGDDLLMANFAVGLNAWAALRLSDARSAFEACARLADIGGDGWLSTWGPGRLSLVGWMEGRFDEVLQATSLASTRAESLGDWSELSLASALRTAVHSARGDAVAAEDEGARGRELGSRGDYVWAPTILLPALAGLRAERGDAEGAARALAGYATPGTDPPRPFRLLVALGLGDRATLRSLFVPRRLRAPLGALTLVGHCAYAAAAAELGERDAAAWAAEDLGPVAESGVLLPIGWNLLVPRVLAAALRCCGRHDEARSWLARAIERATLSGDHPELARCWLEQARLEADAGADGDRGEALRSIGRAVSIARRLGLVPLERAAVELGLSLGRFPGDVSALDEGAGSGTTPLVGTLLFTDIVDSTRRVRTVRDSTWVKVLGEHDRRLRACLARFDGTEFAHTGDGIGAYFASIGDAVGCAHAMHTALSSLEATGGEALPVRIGICHGEATPRGRDLAGSTVSRTVRVMAVAGPGQTVVDASVAAAAGTGWRCAALGSPLLKGFEDEPHELYLLTR